MAIEEQIPTIIAVVGTLIGIAWYAIRDNRERTQRLEKELCRLREFITAALTEQEDRWVTHEKEDTKAFREIFNQLSRMEGRDEARERRAREKRSPI